jgi:hypothetical protein
MKATSIKFCLVIIIFFSSSSTIILQENTELVCVKKHNASNSCHYNFAIEGVNYRYVDIGCKGKRDDILKKAKEGKLGLAKEWKIVCPEVKKPS